jgi:hypothetical protein
MVNRKDLSKVCQYKGINHTIVMHHIVKYREFRRVPKLKDILMMAIEKKKREMQAARKKQQNVLMDNIG